MKSFDISTPWRLSVNEVKVFLWNKLLQTLSRRIKKKKTFNFRGVQCYVTSLSFSIQHKKHTEIHILTLSLVHQAFHFIIVNVISDATLPNTMHFNLFLVYYLLNTMISLIFSIVVVVCGSIYCFTSFHLQTIDIQRENLVLSAAVLLLSSMKICVMALRQI